MNRKALLIAGCLVIPYPVGYWLATTVFGDDPAKMIWSDREAFNRKYFETLSLQHPVRQEQVITKLGGPDITEAKNSGDVMWQLLYYRTHRTVSDGITTKTECSALLFKNRVLVAIGEQAELDYQRAQ